MRRAGTRDSTAWWRGPVAICTSWIRLPKCFKTLQDVPSSGIKAHWISGMIFRIRRIKKAAAQRQVPWKNGYTTNLGKAWQTSDWEGALSSLFIRHLIFEAWLELRPPAGWVWRHLTGHLNQTLKNAELINMAWAMMVNDGCIMVV